jgi:transcription-repair coupling factor (superfamily II helicase)
MLVGTHRLLGKDVAWKDLGLLILDEEQKFGVAQKEWLKKLRPAIDVLSLSATPIPRTLSMSLSGLRSLSILRTPPAGRRPVETEIAPFKDETLQRALVNELQREGQVYVVHNRVLSLHLVQQRVITLLSEAGLQPVEYDSNAEIQDGQLVVAMAHGQMSEVTLARTMSDFLQGKIDVLVASSIVEHGLDSPGANTLVVLHSEWFGLSDLYQLRGRVGRRTKQAFAHFLIGGIERTPDQQVMGDGLQVTETARKRLQALKEADELGSGWSIALRDLEIRGGGNILGHEQHGSMEAIGLLLYAQLLQEEIGRQAHKQGITLFQNSDAVT